MVSIKKGIKKITGKKKIQLIDEVGNVSKRYPCVCEACIYTDKTIPTHNEIVCFEITM